MNFGPQTKLEVQGKARQEAARHRNSECKINLSSRNSLAVSRPTAARHIGRCAAPPANHRCSVGLLPLPRGERNFDYLN